MTCTEYTLGMKKLAMVFVVICILLGIFFTLRPTDRFGSFGDGNDRVSNCQANLSSQNAPIRYSVSLFGYYLTTKPIKKATQSWGTCPYSNYKAKTIAAEFWILGAVFALYVFKRNKSRSTS